MINFTVRIEIRFSAQGNDICANAFVEEETPNYSERGFKFMLSGYLPLLAMLIVTSALAIGMVVGSFILGPKKPNAYKETTYECGMTPVGSARERFPIRFYLIAMLFIVFDIETIFLMPHESYAYLSSRLIKEVALLNGDISSFVPDFVLKAIKKKFKN